ncbi:hypothetical protein [Pseudoxanthomonas kaohsiungensis]|uniref:Uncharacterized protein n=1 Tax=Pseudoxanthomonas kaohsiungensis TaxID=283923 RepID=A0ABW3LU64_9GAMM|nr:hypothetical protein [Pseudoxanthomonas kaohsiungensis]
MYKLLMLSVLALAPLAANANIPSDGSAFSPEKGLDLSGSFEAQRDAIITALADGKTYAEISVQDRQKVTGSLNRISGLLGDAQSVDQLPQATKVEVFNEQELINTVLTQAREDSRLVCTREKKVGSHRTTNTCKTVAERRRDQEESQNALRRNMRVACVPGVSCS